MSDFLEIQGLHHCFAHCVALFALYRPWGHDALTLPRVGIRWEYPNIIGMRHLWHKSISIFYRLVHVLVLEQSNMY